MARWCKQCNRPLDAEHHDIGDKPAVVIDPRTKRVTTARNYGCRVRLIATNPVTGKTFVPNHPQRIKYLDVRYVHEDRFKNDLQA